MAGSQPASHPVSHSVTQSHTRTSCTHAEQAEGREGGREGGRVGGRERVPCFEASPSAPNQRGRDGASNSGGGSAEAVRLFPFADAGEVGVVVQRVPLCRRVLPGARHVPPAKIRFEAAQCTARSCSMESSMANEQRNNENGSISNVEKRPTNLYSPSTKPSTYLRPVKNSLTRFEGLSLWNGLSR